jgi:diguanylate cyclase (GGDEF)-like protein
MKKGTLSYKIKLYLIIAMGFVMVGLLYKFDRYTQYYFLENNKIQKEFSNIKNAELELRYEVLVTSIYMYTNNDKIIKATDNLLKEINLLLNNKYYKSQYPDLYKETLAYKNLINSKINSVYEFETLNSPIKNSIMYLASLLERLPKISRIRMEHKTSKKAFEENNLYAQKMIKVVSSVFLARSSLDKDFIQNLDLSFFRNYKTNSPAFNRFNKVFVANLSVFVNYFTRYTDVLKNINDKSAEKLLEKIHENHLERVNSKIVIIKIVSMLLIAFVFIAVFTVVFLMSKLHTDYEELEILNRRLNVSYITDKLTGLYNRNKFDSDVKKIKNPVLILVNIDRFKHINDYYGSKMGDELLKKVAVVIQNLLPENLNAQLYRLGADDFGILYDYENYPNIKTLARKIIRYFDSNELEIENIKLNISVSIGISTVEPLLENADIALKYIKKSLRKKIMFYSENMNAKKEIQQNIEKSKILYQAIKEGRIEPYFQPIVDTKTQKIVKYEVLARIIINNEPQSIYPYLQIAKDNKLYGDITKIIMKKTYERVAEKEIDFSINISIEDILDTSIVRHMYYLYLKNKSIAKRTTFEILESEAIKDYQEIEKFLQRVKYYGAEIAIDDFGSGYSNFEHLINLNVDYIKIDGSLIRQLDVNPNAYKIVKVINEFAKDTGIRTIAEFVENEEIYKLVKKLNINCCQGYYFYKPQPDFFT